MKRIVFITAATIAIVVLAFASMGAGDSDGGSYKVRAIFDNAAFVIPGEDVKVAGVKVGKIDEVDVTKDFKAAVTLDIADPAYQDFRKDAQCIVRPQSLIGEKFIECSVTQKKAVGEAEAEKLPQITEGEGKGEYLLPVENTARSVDLDLLNTTFRKPYAERFTIILNELGTGLAGRGKDLNAVVRRANPALKELDNVLRLLATQNQQLKQLATNSDTVLAPLARERKHVSGFIENSSEVAKATAERRVALEQDIQKLPKFLTELRPTMQRLGEFADQATPVLRSLNPVAPKVNEFIRQLGPFSQAAIPALTTLGDAAEVGTPAVKAALPITKDLRATAKQLRPVGATAAELLESFQKVKGVERLMDYVFFQVAAINGFDSIGHYLRAALLVNTCASYAIELVPGCSANFGSAIGGTRAAASRSITGQPRDRTLAAVRALLNGAKLSDVLAALNKDKAAKHKTTSEKDQAAAKPTETAASNEATAPSASATPDASATPESGPSPDPGTADSLLDYLFGGDAL